MSKWQDQWLSSKSSVGKPEVKTGGIKPSASAPSGLPGANTSQKSLFDDGDDDLFAPPKESRYIRILLIIQTVFSQTLLYHDVLVTLLRRSYPFSCFFVYHTVRRSLKKFLSCLKTRMMILTDLSLATNLLPTQAQEWLLLMWAHKYLTVLHCILPPARDHSWCVPL